MALDGLPRAAGGDPERLVVVARAPAGGERVAEPELLLDGHPVGGVRQRRGALVGGDHQVGVGLVEHAHAVRVADLAVDQVVRDLEQAADVGDVLALDLARELRAPGGRGLEDEAALGALGDDHGVLRELRAHQAEDLGPVVHPVREADPATGDAPAAQVDALHRRRVDVDLDPRRGLRHRRHVTRAQLEGDHLPPGAVRVGAQRRVDQQQLVAQDAVVVERGDLVEVGQDLLAQGQLAGLVARVRGVEAQLEVAHELGRHRRVGRQHVVLVALGEARPDPLAVAAVGAQQRELAPVQARRHHQPVERVGLALAAPHGADRVGHALAAVLEVERAVVRAEDHELLHPGLGVLVVAQARGDLLDHPQPEVLEHRHDLGELDLLAHLVEAQQRAAAARGGLGVQVDHERPVAVGEPLEAGDVAHRGLWLDLRAVVIGEARPPARRQLAAEARTVDAHQLLAQALVPGARERHDLALEVAERDVREAVGAVHGGVDVHALGLGVDAVGLDALRVEAAAQERAEPVEQLGGRARGRHRRDQRGAAPVRVAPPEQPDRVAVEPEQRDDRAPEVLLRRGEQLVLGEGLEQRDRRLVVVRALDEVLGDEDAAQLARQQRRLLGRLGVGLGGEQAEHPRLEHDAAGDEPAHRDVVHPRALVHGREPVRLRDDEHVPGGRPLALQRRELVERYGLRVRRGGLVGEQPEPGARHDPSGLLADVVLAVAEEDEVALQQPVEERERLVDVLGVRPLGARGDLDHARHAGGEGGEVIHAAVHGLEHVAQRRLDRRELGRREAAVEVEVHHRLAHRRVARVADADDAAGRVALDAHDRVQHALDEQAARLELGGQGVHEEREVPGVGLDHGAVWLGAAVAGPRGESPHRDRLGAAGRDERVQRGDLVEERLGRGLAVVGAPPAAQVGTGERPDRGRDVRAQPLVDEPHQPLAQRREPLLPGVGGAHGGPSIPGTCGCCAAGA